jgi:hypothetical protein
VRRHLLVLVGALVLVVAGAGVALGSAPARLSAHGPSEVDGTAATAVFTVGDRTLRQVRYDDRGILDYTFELRNDGALPLTVTGLAQLEPEPKLFRLLDLHEADGDAVEISPRDSARVTLRIRMVGCESLSARAGSFVTQVALRTTRAGFVDEEVRVALPEQLHTGSPREASCPRSTATSRPPG